MKGWNCYDWNNRGKNISNYILYNYVFAKYLGFTVGGTVMRKWLKSWWFSIAMWLFAIFIPTWTIIIINLFDEDLIYLTMILINCITPTLMLISIGAANMPKKGEKENE